MASPSLPQGTRGIPPHSLPARARCEYPISVITCRPGPAELGTRLCAVGPGDWRAAGGGAGIPAARAVPRREVICGQLSIALLPPGRLSADSLTQDVGRREGVVHTADAVLYTPTATACW